MKPIRVCAVVAAALLSSCVESMAARPDTRLDPASTSGLVVASFSLADFARQPRWAYKPVGATEGKLIQAESSTYNPLIRAGDAYLIPLVLAEGEYELYAWSVTDTGDGIRWSSTSPFSLRFRVTRGKATYVGNLALLVRKDIERWSLRVTDRRQTELPLFLEKFTNVREQDIEFSILSGEGPVQYGTEPHP